MAGRKCISKKTSGKQFGQLSIVQKIFRIEKTVYKVHEGAGARFHVAANICTIAKEIFILGVRVRALDLTLLWAE